LPGMIRQAIEDRCKYEEIEKYQDSQRSLADRLVIKAGKVMSYLGYFIADELQHIYKSFLTLVHLILPKIMC